MRDRSVPHGPMLSTGCFGGLIGHVGRAVLRLDFDLSPFLAGVCK